VTDDIVAIIADACSSETPVLSAVEATFCKASPISSAYLLLSLSVLTM